jgi:DNA-binding transcriptional regulator YiaG
VPVGTKRSEGAKSLSLFNSLVKHTSLSAADVARKLGVTPGAAYKWREVGEVPEAHRETLRVFADICGEYQDFIGQKKRKKRPAKSPGPGAPWEHTSPKAIQAFRERYGLTEAETARQLGVSVGTLRNWTLHDKTAMEKTQKRVAALMAKYDEEARFLAGSHAAKTEPALANRPKTISRRDRLAAVLFEFCDEDGMDLTEATLTVADVLRHLRVLGKLPE